jgi:predicted DCC family thiol-disulfide oxidoreductase YuxK
MVAEEISEGRPLLVFDGDCAVCSRSVQFVLSHERRHDLLFVRRDSELGKALRRRFGLESVESMLWIENGSARIESDAVLHVARYISGWCRVALLAYLVPPPLRNWAYRVFARNRRRILAQPARCIMPAPGQKTRFLD